MFRRRRARLVLASRVSGPSDFPCSLTSPPSASKGHPCKPSTSSGPLSASRSHPARSTAAPRFRLTTHPGSRDTARLVRSLRRTQSRLTRPCTPRSTCIARTIENPKRCAISDLVSDVATPLLNKFIYAVYGPSGTTRTRGGVEPCKCCCTRGASSSTLRIVRSQTLRIGTIPPPPIAMMAEPTMIASIE